VVAPEIASLALEKEHNDEAEYASAVKTTLFLAPIHTGLDGGMNRVFLAQVGGNIPPARVPPPTMPPQPPAVGDNDSQPNLAGRLFGGLFGSKPAATQVAATEGTTQERGADASAAPKPKPAPHSEIATAVAAKPKAAEKPNEPPKAAPQETAAAPAARSKPAAQQEANAAPPPATGSVMKGAQPAPTAGSFDSRWGGLQ
jgi:hypothetical protein